MTTLIEIRGGDGRLIGRCDARCHDATQPEYNCCCGGRYHGARVDGGQTELDRRRSEYGQEILDALELPAGAVGQAVLL